MFVNVVSDAFGDLYPYLSPIITVSLSVIGTLVFARKRTDIATAIGIDENHVVLLCLGFTVLFAALATFVFPVISWRIAQYITDKSIPVPVLTYIFESMIRYTLSAVSDYLICFLAFTLSKYFSQLH